MASKHNMALVQATRFAAAVEGNDIKSAKRLLKRGADVNTRCPDPRDLQTSWFALLRAAYLGHYRLVNILLANGARNDLRLQYDQITQSSSRHGNDLNVELASATAIYVAAARHHEHGNGLKIIRELLKYEADPNACNALSSTPLMAATEHGGGPIFLPGRALRDIDECETDTTNIVTVLLEGGADPTRRDRNGWTALLLGCYIGNLPEVKCLLEYTTPNFISTSKDYGEERLNDIAAAEQLARSHKNAKFNKYDHSHSDYATIKNQSKTKYLSTIVDDRDENGRTSLMLACQQKKPDIVRLLLKHGAYIDAETPSNGWTSLMYCLVNGSNQCVEILIQNGISLGIQKYPSTGIKRRKFERNSMNSEIVNSDLSTTTSSSSSSLLLSSSPSSTAVALKKDSLLFPRDKTTGWTPAMIGAHHCVSVQHAFTLRLVLEAGGPVNPEIYNADPIAFPNETRTAIDLASARGNTAALRLFADAKKRWKEFQTIINGRLPLPTINENLKKMLPIKKDIIEIKQEEKAKRDRQRRREERFNRKRDKEEEKKLLLKRIQKRKKEEHTEKSLTNYGRNFHADGFLPEVKGKDGEDKDENSHLDKVILKSFREKKKYVKMKKKVINSQETIDLEEQLIEALKEVARLRVVISDTRDDRNHWKQVTRERENEITRNRKMFQKEREKLLRQIQVYEQTKK